MEEEAIKLVCEMCLKYRYSCFIKIILVVSELRNVLETDASVSLYQMIPVSLIVYIHFCQIDDYYMHEINTKYL